MTVTVFGMFEGVSVQEIVLRSKAGALAHVLTYGAVVRDLQVPLHGKLQRVVLGLNTIEDYHAHSPHFGAMAGRYGNRIARGQFELDGKVYHLPLNQAGKHSLHGGGAGFGKRLWTLKDHTDNSVTLTQHSPSGDAGYPGTLDVTCRYVLEEPACLRVEVSAVTDAATPINVIHHSYFNLDGSPDILDHELTLNADFYTPTDVDLIPTGEVLGVKGTKLDFTAPRPIRGGPKYDNNFILRQLPLAEGGLVHAARVRSPKNGLVMDVHTTEPAIQFYDAAKVSMSVPGLGGIVYGPYAGLCLEAQHYPDAPNHRHFPSAILRPGQHWHETTEYRFVAPQ